LSILGNLTEQGLAQNLPSNYLRIEPADTASKMTCHRLTPAYYSWAVSYLVADRSAVFARHTRDHIRDINEDLEMGLSLKNGDSAAAPRSKPLKPDTEKESDTEKQDEAIDEAEQESFPASDAPAYPDFK
jgi:hypothetical protein